MQDKGSTEVNSNQKSIIYKHIRFCAGKKRQNLPQHRIQVNMTQDELVIENVREMTGRYEVLRVKG